MSTYEEWAEGIDALSVLLRRTVTFTSPSEPTETAGMSSAYSGTGRAEILDFMRRHGRTNISEFVREAVAWAIREGMTSDDEVTVLLRESGPSTAKRIATETGREISHVRRKLISLEKFRIVRRVGTEESDNGSVSTLWGGGGMKTQYALDGRPVKNVSLTMAFDDGAKVRMRVSGVYAARLVRALTEPDDEPRWEGGE